MIANEKCNLPFGVGVHHPNLRGHTKAWECITSTRGATPKQGSPYLTQKV